jgi:hypothetical protein
MLLRSSKWSPVSRDGYFFEMWTRLCLRPALNRQPRLPLRFFASAPRVIQIWSRPNSSINGHGRRENIYTIPNLLTLSRIAACPIIGWAIIDGSFHFASALLVGAAITDFVGFAFCLSPKLTLPQGRWVRCSTYGLEDRLWFNSRSCRRQGPCHNTDALSGLEATAAKYSKLSRGVKFTHSPPQHHSLPS